MPVWRTTASLPGETHMDSRSILGTRRRFGYLFEVPHFAPVYLSKPVVVALYFHPQHIGTSGEPKHCEEVVSRRDWPDTPKGHEA
jgi:hypothetical protein